MAWRAAYEDGRRRPFPLAESAGPRPVVGVLDPYMDTTMDTTLRGEPVERLLRELKSPDLARLRGAEREVVEGLMACCRRSDGPRAAPCLPSHH